MDNSLPLLLRLKKILSLQTFAELKEFAEIAPSSKTDEEELSAHLNVHALTQANRTLEKVLMIDPCCAEAWCLWGDILIELGIFYNEMHYFNEATLKFSKANDLMVQADQNLRKELFWKWGLCWYHLGKHSGEAIDFHKTVNLFRQAHAIGIQSDQFFYHFANAVFDLGLLIGRQEFLEEGIQFYEKALDINPQFFAAYLNLAIAFQMLYQINGKESTFLLANKNFKKAAELNSKDAKLWLKWGTLFAVSGKIKHQIDHLNVSIEKFQKADECDACNPLILSQWAEVLILIGAISERLDLLREAESKILQGLNSYPENGDFWGLYGSCLNELGRYFEDELFYLQAIQKFEHGLTLNPHLVNLWYGLANSHFSLGEHRGDVQVLEKSLDYYAQVAELETKKAPQLWNEWGIALMRLTELTDDIHFLKDAVEKFEKAISIQSEDKDSDFINSEWLYNYGCALDFLGDFEEDAQYYERSIQVLTRVLQIDPQFASARFNLALAFSHLGELTSDIESLEKAIEHFQIIISLDNEDEMAWNEWGLTLIQLAELMQDPAHPEESQKLFIEAESKLLQATALGSITAFYNLACLYSLTLNYQSAMYYIERAERQDCLPPLEDLLQDDWLEPLRETPSFRTFINNLTTKHSKEDKT